MATAASKKTKARRKSPRSTKARAGAGKKATGKPTSPKKRQEAPSASPDNVRNVFLAGLGLYGKAFEEAQAQLKENRCRIEQRREKANEFFEELIKRGEKVESDTRKKIKGLDLPDLKIPELKLTDHEQLREELRARLDKARDAFHTLRDAVSAKSEAA